MFDLSPKGIEVLTLLCNPQITEDEVFALNEDIWKQLDEGVFSRQEHGFIVKRILAKLGKFEQQRSSQG